MAYDEDYGYGSDDSYTTMDDTGSSNNDEYDLSSQLGNQGGYWQNSNEFTQPDNTYNSGLGSMFDTPGYINDTASGTQFWQNPDGRFAGYQSPGGEFTPYDYGDQASPGAGGINWGKMGESLLGGLGKAFTNNKGEFDMGKTIAGISPILAGIMNNQYQKKQGAQTTQQAQQLQERIDPFAAQRARYQQELASSQDRLNQFRSNPNENRQYATLRDQATMAAMRSARKHGMNDVAMSQALLPQLTQAQMSVEDQMLKDRQQLQPYTGASNYANSALIDALMKGSASTNFANTGGGYAQALTGLAGLGSSQESNSSDFQKALIAALTNRNA